MNLSALLLRITDFLVVIPAAIICYLPMKNQLKISPVRLLVLCAGLFTLYVPTAAWLTFRLNVPTNGVMLPSLFAFFLLYRKTIKTDFSRTLSVYLSACAMMTFPSIFAFTYDAALHPTSGAASFSAEASLFQLALSGALVLLLAYPLYRYSVWMLDSLDLPKVWYILTVLPMIIIIFNLMMIPHSYQTLHSGRSLQTLPLLEIILLVLVLYLYLLFYQIATMILARAKQDEEVRILTIQAEQYQTLQNHIQQTRRLNHDFRHLIHGLTGLADSGDFERLRTQLHEYGHEVDSYSPVTYCRNAALNALFNYYGEMASSEHIHLDWKIQIPDPLAISELDLCSLLGNLIENAIAGCKTFAENRRYFNLHIVLRNMNCLCIVSTNGFDDVICKKQQSYLSTKHAGEGGRAVFHPVDRQTI